MSYLLVLCEIISTIDRNCHGHTCWERRRSFYLSSSYFCDNVHSESTVENNLSWHGLPFGNNFLGYTLPWWNWNLKKNFDIRESNPAVWGISRKWNCLCNSAIKRRSDMPGKDYNSNNDSDIVRKNKKRV